MAVGVVEGLERVEVEHQQRERAPSAAAIVLVELPLERAVVAQPGQGVVLGPDLDRAVGLGVLEGDRGLAGEQLGQLELVLAEVGLRRRPSAPTLSVPIDLAADAQRDDDHRLGLGRACPGSGPSADRDGRRSSRTASPCAMTQPLIPTSIGPS